MKWKKTLIFILFLLTGIVLGTLLTSLCSSVSFLNWLTIGEQIGIGVPNPIVLDIGVMTLSFHSAVTVVFPFTMYGSPTLYSLPPISHALNS